MALVRVYSLWSVLRPRLSSPPSLMSSWISVAEWTISNAEPMWIARSSQCEVGQQAYDGPDPRASGLYDVSAHLIEFGVLRVYGLKDEFLYAGDVVPD